MAVRFVLGRAGSGKTQWCLDHLLGSLRENPLGPTIYWILPRQATFQAERQLACASGLGGYFRARIVSFEDFGKEVLELSGGNAVPEVSDRGRRMILGHLLRRLQPQLKFFQRVAHYPGVARELDTTFGEFERCKHRAADLDEQLAAAYSAATTTASASIPPPDVTAAPSLVAKLHDLALIGRAYAEFLGQDMLDPNRRLNESLAAIERCCWLAESDVFVDSFYEFTAFERQVLASLAKACRSVSIGLLLDPNSPSVVNPHHIPDDMSLFHKTEQTYRRLWFTFHEQNIEIAEPIRLDQAHRFASPDLAEVERWPVAASLPASARAAKSIHWIESPDRALEVDAAARWIVERVTTGLRYRDIAVLVRSEEDYHELISAAFAEHGIPFFIDRRRSASHHPLIRLIRAAMAIARRNWETEAVFALIKTGLAGLKMDEADTLENYVLLHGIDHGTWTSTEAWTGRRRPRDEEGEGQGAASEPASADALRRRLVDRIQPFVRAITNSRQLPVRRLAQEMFALLERLEARATIARWIEHAASHDRLEERGEHERTWDEIGKLFDELVELFGDEQMSLDDFSTVLDAALEEFDLALTPAAVDEVLVGSVDRTRAPSIKACAVLGLDEGQFPRTSREKGVLSDNDRRALGQLRIDLEPDAQRLLLDEYFLGYLAFTRASEQLLLTRSLIDEGGRPAAPSPLWRRLIQQFPASDIERAPRLDALTLRQIATPRQLLMSLMRWARDGGDPTRSEAGVYQWFANYNTGSGNDPIDTIRHRAWKALTGEEPARLETSLAKGLFHSPLPVKIAQLESFRACPFQHFARFGLGLRSREHRRVTRADLSRVFHLVLDRLVADLARSGRSWTDLNELELRAAVATLTRELGGGFRGDLMLSSARNRYLLDYVERMLHWVTAAQNAASRRGEFRPALAGVRFGDQSSESEDGHVTAMPPLVLPTPAGNTVRVEGMIDRVDQMEDGSACVIEYRMVAEKLNATMAYHGLSLQLLTYLLVIQQNGEELGGRHGQPMKPAAALNVSLLRRLSERNPADTLEADDPRFHLALKPRGILDLRVAEAFDNAWSDGWSDVLHIYMKKDGAPGHVNSADGASTDQFSALLNHTRRRIGELADRIIAGDIEIRPYRMGNQTACPRCQFRDICRFEPRPGGYADLPGLSREQWLVRAEEEM